MLQKILHATKNITCKVKNRKKSIKKVVQIGLNNAKEHYLSATFGYICPNLGQSDFSRKVEIPSLMNKKIIS